MAVVLAALMVLSNLTASVFAATTEGPVANTEGRKSENTITVQPQETTVTEGETAVFSVEATGKVHGYQWMINTTGKADGWFPIEQCFS